MAGITNIYNLAEAAAYETFQNAAAAAVVAQTASLASAAVTQANAYSSAFATWVFTEAAAARTLEDAEAAAGTALVAALAAAENVWKNAVADAAKDRAYTIAAANKALADAYADAALAYVNAVAPAGAAKAATIAAAGAAQVSAAAAAYAAYSQAVAGNAVAFTNSVAWDAVLLATATQAANSAYVVAMAGIEGDNAVASAELNAARVSSLSDCDVEFDQHQATDPTSWWLGVLWSVLWAGAILVGVMALVYFFPVTLPFVLAFGIAALVIGIGMSGYQRYSSGQSALQIVGGSVADAVGISSIYAGMYNEDLATGQHLGLNNGEMGSQFGTGIIQFAGTLIGARRFFNCFIRGTEVQLADEAVDEAIAQSEESGPFDWTSVAIGVTCISMGVAGNIVSSRKKRKRRSELDSYQDNVDALFADEETPSYHDCEDEVAPFCVDSESTCSREDEWDFAAA
ncbi:MAG: hypothetical protein ABI614_04695 [Planctomycetota bacterium]